LKTLGSAADANSVWEIDLARRAGFEPKDIVFTGVGKSNSELECAVPLGLKAINVESAGELSRIETIAERLGRPARVAVRVNPDIDAQSHPHISTGLKINKFGVDVAAARELFASLTSRSFLKLVAVHVHIGSQITSLAPLRRAARFVAGLTAELQRVKEESVLEVSKLRAATEAAAAAAAAAEKAASLAPTSKDEVARAQAKLAEVTAIIDDPATELSVVIRKNVEKLELEAYLKGLRYKANGK